MAPTFPTTPAATPADWDPPWKLKKVEMLFGVAFAKVLFDAFGHNLSLAPAFDFCKNSVNTPEVPDESVLYQTVIGSFGRSIFTVFSL